MTPEQGLGNFAALINLGIQRGLFQSADEVHAMTEAHNVLAKLLPPSFVDGGTIPVGSGYVTTATSDKHIISTATQGKSPQYAGETKTI